MKKLITGAAVVLPMIVALSGYAADSSVIRFALNQDIRSSQPGVNRDGNTDDVLMHVVEGLVGYREDGTVGPMLASSWQVSDEGKTYTFQLRDGVTFHNGKAMTAKDVVWSWQHWNDPKTQWRCVREFDGSGLIDVTAVSAPDDHTVVMQLAKPVALFLDTLARTDCGAAAVISSDSLDADGKWLKPIGTGPFSFDNWKHGEYVSLKRFAAYASLPGKPDGFVGGKQALVDEVRFMAVPDAATVKAGLSSAAVDLAQVSPIDAADLKKDPNIAVEVAANAQRHGILIQTDDPLLKNVKLRQAIASAMDTQQIALGTSQGLATASNANISTSSAFYGEVEKQGFHYDPARTARLLKEAGYQGETIEIIANKRSTVPSFDMAIIAQAMLQAAGINAKVTTMEWATQLERYQAGRYQMMAFTYSARFNPALAFEQIVGDKSKEKRKVWGDPEAIKLTDSLGYLDDQAEIQKTVDQLHKMMIDQVPLMFFYPGLDIVAHRKAIEGYRAWLAASARLWNVSLKS
ncbi:ABC transporter substrate-binding protein [Erwiniaceae bacterium BAC15a-03b]|uniref:ABC transporter substrate-binding protein n=1 Tax=Winslowiella arboricola TaxID=2978220 RepID=A0A9J6Q2V2_9GAMM|nr:ABC transporter substrate-binding protein [Winslowiella arboricola]MCU5772981.1 ABC transporter substrate-binding protein [Winslowiella arboricola]MCU5780591.1 ABC transporter substrate-binding protein [Winslowiella arboricola]